MCYVQKVEKTKSEAICHCSPLEVQPLAIGKSCLKENPNQIVRLDHIERSWFACQTLLKKKENIQLVGYLAFVHRVIIMATVSPWLEMVAPVREGQIFESRTELPGNRILGNRVIPSPNNSPSKVLYWLCFFLNFNSSRNGPNGH